jgi:hypothetical protein
VPLATNPQIWLAGNILQRMMLAVRIFPGSVSGFSRPKIGTNSQMQMSILMSGGSLLVRSRKFSETYFQNQPVGRKMNVK